MTAIQTVNLTRRFKNLVAVDALNLTVEQGELFALLGVNGAGKTTAIKMLSCILRPSSGDALLLGDSILTHTEKVKAKINVSPQETAVARNLSVRENLELIAKLYGCDKRIAQQRTDAMLTTMDLTSVAGQRAKSLSGGYMRRLSIAMALITEPKILFLDEPTLGLDVLARRDLWSAIQKLKGKITIILTTHYMEEAQALSDRIGIMLKGTLKVVGTPQALMDSTGTASVEDAFITIAGRTEVTQ